MQKVLVVDDSEINRELLRSILKDEYAVETAEDGEQALQKLREDCDRITAILLDLHMPRANGFVVIAGMKEHGWINRVPVLIISGEHAVETENRCLEQGVSDFIHKPFEASIVKNRVKNAIELFNYKRQLEQKVEEQAETLKKQSQIIQ